MQTAQTVEASVDVTSGPAPEQLSGIGVYPGPSAQPTHHHPYRPVPQFAPPPKWHVARVMPARPRELLAALGLVAAADLAAWRGDRVELGGSVTALFFLAVPALLVVAARARRTSLRLFVTLAMLVAVAARCAYAPNAGTVALGLVGIFALAITLRSRTAFLTQVAASFGGTFATLPLRFVAAGSGLKRVLTGATGDERGRSLSPIAIPLALVSLFVAIFGLANPLVGKWLLLAGGSVALPPALRALSWLGLAAGAVLLLRPALARSTAKEAADTTSEAARVSLNVARNALAALNALFIGYNALDARYLWAGSPPPGVSERAYAHEGAAWLTVGIALLTVVVGVMFRGALAHDARARLPRVLAFAWLGQGVILALGTYRRLWIHIGTSGLSSLRILGLVGTTLVVAGLVVVGVKLLRRRSFAWLLRRQLDAAVFGLLAFSLAPTHLLSAPLNVRNVMAHDYQALVNVEEEAAEVESAAALLPMLDHDDERIRRGIAALLLNERDALRARVRGGGLRDRDLATTRTLGELEAASPKLALVLGDVERSDAITPFEYIRNSSIEGEIAQSEISKVELAPTRREKPVKQWIEAQGWPNSAGFSSSFTLRTTSDPDRVEATVNLTAPSPDRSRDVVLVVERAADGRQWRVASERGDLAERRP